MLENPSHNLLIEVYTENKDGRKPVKKPKEEKMTLAKLALIVNDLAKQMQDGFKQVNTRIDRIDARLDYIVKANNLKDSK